MRDLVLDFLAGYLNARGNAGSELDMADDLAVVRYRLPMGRPSELFYWGATRAQLPLEPGMWVTLIGRETVARCPPLPGTLYKLADEFLMEATLPLRAGAAAGLRVSEIVDPDEFDLLNASREFAEFPRNQVDRARAAFFLARADGEAAATARYGRASADTVVVDQVLTLPAFRRRGLGEALMAAMAGKALGQGASRMLLISSEMGRPLYERVGFRMLAPIAVYGQG